MSLYGQERLTRGDEVAVAEEIYGRDEQKTGKLYIEDGMRLEVLRSDNEVDFVGRVKDFEGKTLTLVNDNGGEVPHAIYGTEIKLRGVWTGIGLVTYHGTVFGSTNVAWKIGEISDWYGWERRNFYRQGISVEARVLRTFRAHAASAWDLDVKVACRLLDVSANGCLFACSKAVYMHGDRVHITDAELIPGEPPFSFHATVVRIEKARFNNIYGCRMDGLTMRDQDRLARAVFRLQQIERRETQNKD